jgi:hypothetical protein
VRAIHDPHAALTEFFEKLVTPHIRH